MRPVFQMFVVLVGIAAFFVTAGLALDYTIFGYVYLAMIPVTLTYMCYSAIKHGEISYRYDCCGLRRWDLIIANFAIYPILMSLCWPMIVIIELGGLVESRLWVRQKIVFAEYFEGYDE